MEITGFTPAILTTLTRLFIDSTIGLAILGKYRDKAARGTV